MDVQNEALDTQADSTEVDYSNEDSVNAAAAKEVEAAKTSVEQSGKIEVKKPDVTGPAKVEQKTAPEKQPAGQPVFDAEKSFADVQKQLTETRKWATQMAQERAELRKQLEVLQANQRPMVEKLVRDNETGDLQQLQRALQTQDPQALNSYLMKRDAESRRAFAEQYEAKLAAQGQEVTALKYDREVERRRTDSAQYPNFTDLEPTMKELVESGQVRWDDNQPIGEVIDHLYNLSKTQHSEEAIKQAEQHGRQKAETELANEAKAAVATGGKGVSTSPADLHKMPLDKLEQLAIQLHGIADRD